MMADKQRVILLGLDDVFADSCACANRLNMLIKSGGLSSSSQSRPLIAIFDSGVGGISIYRELCQTIQNATYLYCCDNEAFPYGTKTEEQVITRTTYVLQKLLAGYEPEIIVIACNT